MKGADGRGDERETPQSPANVRNPSTEKLSMFEDIFETRHTETPAHRGNDIIDRTFTGAELLAEAGLPSHAIRKILDKTADTGARSRIE